MTDKPALSAPFPRDGADRGNLEADAECAAHDYTTALGADAAARYDLTPIESARIWMRILMAGGWRAPGVD